MKTSRIWKAAAAAALALATMLAVPATAQANGYTPTPGDSTPSQGVQTVVVPGGTVSFSFLPGSFDPSHRITFTLVGEGVGPSNLATFFTVATTAEKIKAPNNDGSLNASVTIPANGSGVYKAKMVNQNTNAVVGEWEFVVQGTTGAGTGLATTGSAGDQLLWAWVAGGALAFVGGGALVFASVRKQRKLAE